MTFRSRPLGLSLLGLALVAPGLPGKSCRAEEPAAADGSREALAVDAGSALEQVPALVGQLDSDRCDVRERATRQLAALASRPELADRMAMELRRALLSEAATFEMRTRLAPILAMLPDSPPPAPEFDAAELGNLVERLEDESYGVRQTVAERITWSLGNPAAVCPTMLALRQKLADFRLEPGIRRELEPLWQKARAAWLSSDPATWRLPAVTDEQIQGWIADVVEEAPDGWREPTYPPHETARRELEYCLARDELVPRIQQLVSAKLAEPIDPVARYRLQDVHDWTLPGLVAEIWEDTGLGSPRIVTVQYLALGVPCQPEGAERPSLFDRADERKAHCVSGNSLSPGDWPVGIAFPNPIAADKFFHLIYTPTPRLRLAYQANVDGDERQRAQALARRTLDAYLAEKRPLTLGEVVMLDMFDAQQVSEFAGAYFLAVDDQLFPPGVRQNPSGRASLHQSICFGLAQRGTRKAIPGLMKAIERDRFLKPTPGSPYNWPWIAALAISINDPWPQVERWLADLVNKSDPLVVGPEGQNLLALPAVEQALPPLRDAVDAPAPPDVGGSAAAILLARHDLPPWTFRLERIWQPPLDNFDIPACRFTSAEDRAAVLRWWSKQGGASLRDGDYEPATPPASP